ncbi:non-hydrolyzing UDP-N-acetylglucosamine 2-epimerase [Nubsella zeaxanthinifaciens]|uniref:non-hydrolyzing UDP-N-acetylglucosamine 2-epimerase n=1 Tax=Nubsella zeaxanthinifaciens TaxID=392412 RepID=UPI000DE20530|nr:UDP-N-acetylglucosamine 2-epimerase (non-hydrolyzing) [Nubsella zeaxanthinifaciens]
MKITLIAGARPNFMKIAPIIHAIKKAEDNGANITYRLVHTGQHYDEKMSDTFFHELAIPAPDAHLGGGGGTQAEQTAAIMVAFEKELMNNPADLVLVVGDVTSTMACAIVAKKLNTKVAHVEAGIRSFDLTMPEEINRMVTDSITDYFFTTSVWAGNNLKHTGIADDQIFFVGNVMIDTLRKNEARFVKPSLWETLNLSQGNYFVMTLHRPGNVDEQAKFKALLEAIIAGSNGKPLIFPVHPRTKNIIEESGINLDDIPNLHLTSPMGYLEFNYLVKHAMAVITDSGGITEETTVMGVPCMTLRDNTERPETCDVGTNELVGTDPAKVGPALAKLFAGNWKPGAIPEKWDGKAAERIVDELLKL